MAEKPWGFFREKLPPRNCLRPHFALISISMVTVAQLAEHLAVAERVEGSSPSGHPTTSEAQA